MTDVPGRDRSLARARSRFRSLRWVLRHRALSAYHLIRYARFLLFKLGHPNVRTDGMVFLGRRVRVRARHGHGRVILGPWVHLGDDTRLYAHEGTLRIGEKTVLGSGVTITGYLDIDIGGSCLIADDCYITDFDHRADDLDTPIKDQGLAKSPVRIGADCWLGVRTTVLRGARIGRGVVVAAHAVVRRELPAFVVAAGVPAKVVKDRRAAYRETAAERAYLEGLARGATEDLDRASDRETSDGATSDRASDRGNAPSPD